MTQELCQQIGWSIFRIRYVLLCISGFDCAVHRTQINHLKEEENQENAQWVYIGLSIYCYCIRINRNHNTKYILFLFLPNIILIYKKKYKKYIAFSAQLTKYVNANYVTALIAHCCTLFAK